MHGGDSGQMSCKTDFADPERMILQLKCHILLEIAQQEHYEPLQSEQRHVRSNYLTVTLGCNEGTVSEKTAVGPSQHL